MPSHAPQRYTPLTRRDTFLRVVTPGDNGLSPVPAPLKGDITIGHNPFFKAITSRQQEIRSLLCVGLDPDVSRLPDIVRGEEQPIFAFNKAIVDATVEFACCYKPQIAHFAAEAAEEALLMTMDYIRGLGIPVILDAKRGDIGSTAERYASEIFDRYQADAVTINPYLGADSMEPFLSRRDKGVFILCKTSNPGSADLQNLPLETGRLLYEHVAASAAGRWNANDNVALVTGATHPRELARIRELTGNMTFLIPGIGAQGGDIEATLAAGEGGGMIISSSRAILYASSGPDFAEAAGMVADATGRKIRQHLSEDYFRPDRTMI